MKFRFKQCIVTRDDLALSSGKLAVQVAHAAMMSSDNADSDIVNDWKDEGQRKIVLRVKTLDDMLKVKRRADDLGVPNCLVVDFGLTEIPENTTTVLGIGPALNNDVDKVTGNLKLFRS